MKWGLIALVGLAAFAAYKYSSMSEEQKKNMADNSKGKGKKLYDDYIPDKMKNMFADQ
jgi:hypothetical protein